MSTIQLQSIGHVPAIPASEVREGDVRMFNFGYTSLVIKVIEKTAKTLSIITFSSDGKYYMTDIRKTSLVAVVKRDQDVSEHRPTQAWYKRDGMVDVSEYFLIVEPVQETEVIETVEVEHVTENNLTNQQQLTLSNRLNKDNVTPLRLFKSNHTDSILLECINTNLDNPQPFYFIIQSNGNEMGKGYNYSLTGYTLIQPYENETIETAPEQQKQPSGITYKLNDEREGIEIYFDSKPSETVREQLKMNSFRWSKQGFWYAKQSNETISLAKQLAGEQINNSIPEPITYPYIEIYDNETYTIDKRIQDAEHESNWIFRSTKRDHNKELYSLFTTYTNNVKALLELTDNEYYIYKLKSGLQRFKRKYHETYIKYLSHKGNNPSWAVTGRGNLNVSRYNKARDRENNLMNELVSLPKQFEQYVNKFRNKIKKEQIAS
jgi:hypothetical protein